MAYNDGTSFEFSRNRYQESLSGYKLLGGMGAVAAKPEAPIKPNSVIKKGALVYFYNPDVDGTFLVLSGDPSSGKVVLWPHQEDPEEVFKELEKALGDAISSEAEGWVLTTKTPEKYLSYWDKEFDGSKPILMSYLKGQSNEDKADRRTVQQFLKENGYYTNKIDGVWGGYSQKALGVFQKEMNIVSTTRFDQATANVICPFIKVTTDVSKPPATKRGPLTSDRGDKAAANTKYRAWVKLALWGTAATVGVGLTVYGIKRAMRR